MLSTLLTTIALFAPVDMPTPPDTVFCQERRQDTANTANTIRQTIRRIVEQTPPTRPNRDEKPSTQPTPTTPPAMPQADEAHTVPPPALPPQANILPVNGLPPVPALNGYWRPTRYGWRWITLPPGVPPPPPELGYFYGFDGTAPYGYNYPAYGPNFGRPFVHPFTFRDYQEFREFQRLYERFRHGRR